MATFRKRFEVIKSSKFDFDVVDTGKRKLKLGRSGGFTINDPGEAREIDARYGYGKRRRPEEALVIPVDDCRVEAGHIYSFGRHPGMPWARYDSMGKRLPDEEGDNDGSFEGSPEEGDTEASGTEANAP